MEESFNHIFKAYLSIKKYIAYGLLNTKYYDHCWVSFFYKKHMLWQRCVNKKYWKMRKFVLQLYLFTLKHNKCFLFYEIVCILKNTLLTFRSTIHWHFSNFEKSIVILRFSGFIYKDTTQTKMNMRVVLHIILLEWILKISRCIRARPTRLKGIPFATSRSSIVVQEAKHSLFL